MRDEIAGGWCLREEERRRQKNPTEVPWATAQAPMAGVFRVSGLDEPRVGAG